MSRKNRADRRLVAADDVAFQKDRQEVERRLDDVDQVPAGIRFFSSAALIGPGSDRACSTTSGGK